MLSPPPAVMKLERPRGDHVAAAGFTGVDRVISRPRDDEFGTDEVMLRLSCVIATYSLVR